MLKWITGCLEENSGRGGTWHIQAGGLEAMSYVSDGFMINLGAVMLKLSAPFTSDIVNVQNPEVFKILKVFLIYFIIKLFFLKIYLISNINFVAANFDFKNVCAKLFNDISLSKIYINIKL